MQWNPASLQASSGGYQDDVNVAGLVHGKDEWGHRVYRFVVPAAKASSHGFAGRTHLVAQLWDGEWRARTLSVKEMKCIFGSSRVSFAVDGDEALALQDLGNAGPLRMVLPFADGLVRFFRTPSSFVPSSIRQIVSEESELSFRGAMDLTHQDFEQRVKKG